MRNIDSIIVHCSATKAGQDFTAADIDCWHRERGFNGIGYHYVIRLDGKLEKGRDVSLAGAHCRGWNERSVGICYIGGLDENGRPADTRTNAQKRVLYQIIMDLQREYNILQVLGHRDTSPDLNGDGVIEPYEYVKACPCFDMKEFLRSGRELLFVLVVALVVPVLLSGCRSKKEVINRESEVRVDSSLNSSSGKSLVKNKVASGKMEECKEWLFSWDKRKMWELADLTLSRDGLVKGDRFIKELKQIIPDMNIEDLPVPYVAMATDIVRDQEVRFDRGSLHEAIRASISIDRKSTRLNSSHSV